MQSTVHGHHLDHARRIVQMLVLMLMRWSKVVLIQLMKRCIFLLFAGNECWCSNETPASSVRVSTSKCDATCPGYPPEYCGNAASALFGYMALGPAPSGTAGGLTSSTPAATSTLPSSSASPSVVTSQQIIVTTQVSVSTQSVSIVVTPTPVISASSSLVHASPSPASSSGVITTSVIIHTSYLILSPTQAPPGSTAAPVTIVQTVATTEQVTVVPVSRQLLNGITI